MSHRSRAAVVFAAALTTAAVAAAAGYNQKPGTDQWTEPSGATGESAQVALTSASYYALRALKLEQFAGTSCVLETGQGALNTGKLNWLDARIQACEATRGQEWKQADVGENQFVTAIAVCSAADDDTIQGLELWGAPLGSGGEARPPTTQVKLEFSTCKKWHPTRACPAGTVATGVRAYKSPGKGIVGLALRCHRIEAPKEAKTP